MDGDVAPGSVVLVRDEEWLVTAVASTADGPLLTVRGLSELARDTTATFYASLDDIAVVDPAKMTVVADDSPGYRRSRLWLEATIRKTALAVDDPSLTVSSSVLADPLEYQHAAVRRALDPGNLRPRILLADAVGLGKTLEIGMILSELIRRGRGERILIVSPRHVLEQMQHEMWTRFAIPFVRLDSVGIQRVRQKLPATRNPFTMYKRAIISIDTLKNDRYLAHLRHHRWDAVVIDESHGVTNTNTQNNRLARVLAPNTDALILASATPHNGQQRVLRRAGPTPRAHGCQARRCSDRERGRSTRRASPPVQQGGGERRRLPTGPSAPSPSTNSSPPLRKRTPWPPNSATSGCTHRAPAPTPAAPPSSRGPWPRRSCLARPRSPRPSSSARPSSPPLTPTKPANSTRSPDSRTSPTEASNATIRSTGKYSALLDRLTEIGVGKGQPTRAVVFAERIATLHWLAENVRRDLKLPADAVTILHGGLTDQEQQAIVESFKQENSPIRVLSPATWRPRVSTSTSSATTSSTSTSRGR